MANVRRTIGPFPKTGYNRWTAGRRPLMLKEDTGYTAIVTQDGEWWIGWVEEIPGVNCQERTRDALLESLTEALGDAIEMNRKDALSAAGDQYEEITITP